MPLTRSVVSLAAALAVAAPSFAQNPPSGFVYQTLSTGALQSATAMAFLPDGRLLITERVTGAVRVFADGVLQAAPWATLPTNGTGSWAERGLLGIAVDPDFVANRHVYVYFTDASGAENRIARLTDTGGVGTNLTVLSPNGALPATLYHNGGAMVFGHDGSLFVATGDGMSSSDAQNPQSWLGKVLRFEVPNLTVPANNPFAGSPVFSLGHRNHFGLAVHPVTGVLYQTENGGALMDELNRIEPGGNYGWPVHEGLESSPDPAFVDPLAAFQPTTAPTGTCFYRGDHYPLVYRNAWFFTEWNVNRLRALTLDAAGGAVTAQSVFDQPPGSGYAIVSGPDGNLWFLTNDNGGFGANELGRYVHVSEPNPSVQLSSVSNKTLGASLTVCVHATNGSIVVPWLSLSRFGAPLPTAFGNLWVPGDAMLAALPVLGDDRAYLALPVPNAPTFLGSSIHAQAIELTAAWTLQLTNATELIVRG